MTDSCFHGGLGGIYRAPAALNTSHAVCSVLPAPAPPQCLAVPLSDENKGTTSACHAAATTPIATVMVRAAEERPSQPWLQRLLVLLLLTLVQVTSMLLMLLPEASVTH